MTLRHFEIYITVCRYLSMSRAADELNMSQPAVSKAIHELEAYYNTTLFDRMNRRIYLTEEGSTLLRYAETVLSQTEEAASVLRDGTAFQICRLSVNVTVAETILPELITAIHKENPGTDLRIRISNSARIEEMLRGNECDIAVIDHKDDDRFEAVPFCQETLGFYASDACISRPVQSAAELVSYRLLVREEGSGSRTCITPLLQRIGYPPERTWESTSDAALILLAEHGHGIAVLPDSCIDLKKTPSLHRIHVPDTELSRTFYLVRLRNKYLNRASISCLKILQEYGLRMTQNG